VFDRNRSMSMLFWAVTPCGFSAALPMFRRNILSLTTGMKVVTVFWYVDICIGVHTVSQARS
jgi:hypothetical protein